MQTISGLRCKTSEINGLNQMTMQRTTGTFKFSVEKIKFNHVVGT